MTRLIDADALMEQWQDYLVQAIGNYLITPADITKIIDDAPTVSADRPTLNRHEVACILADAFCDTCACNFNGIDEWLPQYCDFAETCCPNPVGVGCWEQYLKHKPIAIDIMKGGTE